MVDDQQAMNAEEHDERGCDRCYDCPGCGGGDGRMPKRTVLVSTGTAVLARCEDCQGAGVLCPAFPVGAS